MALKHYFDYLNNTVKNHWNEPAISNFGENITFTYGELAERIARLHVLFENMGVKKGDKIALCGRNSAHWASCFLAINTYEAVAVSILDAFSADSVHGLVNHSESVFFMVGNEVYKNLEASQMPGLKAIINQQTLELITANDTKIQESFNNWDSLYSAKYPNGLSKDDINYPTNNLDDLALINYTSGTTNNPKGVMLSYRSLSSNVQFGQELIPNKAGWSMVSMLPLAHMFGLMFEFLYQLAGGCHVYFLSKTPSPQVLMKAFAEVKPYMILTVPLVIEKIFKNAVFPAIKRPVVKVLWNTPFINKVIRKKVYDKLMTVFGGQLRYLIIGGAALNKEVEICMKQINFPYTVGYGMTECGPILGYEHSKNFKMRSCGKVVHRMKATIDSLNPQKIVGEIIVKGDNMMMGYYKNEEATQAIFTSDGWMRTGDLGIIDAEGNMFIRGRNKNVIIGASGQNIYPEEIEDKLNNQPYVIESIVVQRDNKLTALVFADTAAIEKEQPEKSIEDVMNITKDKLNKLLPAFCRVAQIDLVKEEFEKTPKRSIKRFMYK